MERLAAVPDAFLPGAEGREVLHRLGHGVAVQTKLDPPSILPTDGNVEEGPLADLLVRVARLALAAPLLHHVVKLLPVHDDWEEVDLALGLGLRFLEVDEAREARPPKLPVHEGIVLPAVPPADECVVGLGLLVADEHLERLVVELELDARRLEGQEGAEDAEGERQDGGVRQREEARDAEEPERHVEARLGDDDLPRLLRRRHGPRGLAPAAKGQQPRARSGRPPRSHICHRLADVDVDLGGGRPRGPHRGGRPGSSAAAGHGPRPRSVQASHHHVQSLRSRLCAALDSRCSVAASSPRLA
mmetsp:Transcript_1450/g.3737  ORF Transcript_1450/g.3737 Transcript_1450/m.3737 type:complete len:302 (+) Transcript_1450:463-1368(+)